MDEEKIVSMYTNGRYTLRHLAETFGANHHRIKRILLKHGVEITRRNTLKEFTQEHRDKLSASMKKRTADGWVPYNKGLKTADRKNGRELLLKNMATHLHYNVTHEWLDQFADIEKLKFLNKSISRPRDKVGFTDDKYKEFITFFYSDEQFNMLYDKWIGTDDRWLKPSLDHKNPKGNNGSLVDIENLQFLSWLENRSKANILQEQWDDIKSRIGEYFV